MNYVILHYFFMVHICNIKMLANTLGYKSNNNYDIDGFINQLLASQKFDELAEKVADKAVSKIRDVEATPIRLERFIDNNKENKTADTSAQMNYRDQSNREYDKESNIYDSNFKLRNDNPSGKEGKIDTHAVMDETTSQSENLRLKYKYLTKTAYEKKVFNDRASDDTDRNSVPKNDKNEDTSIQNVKKSPEEFQEHDSKTDGRDDNPTEKNQHGSKTDFEEENRWRYGSRDDDRKGTNSNRETKHSNTPYNDRNDDRNESPKKKDRSREDMDSRHQEKRSREVQNSRPEFKSVAKGQVEKKGDLENGTIEEETISSHEEDHTENSVPSAENTQENNEESAGEQKASGSGENVGEEEPPPFQFRAQAESYPDVDENKVTSADHNQEDHKETFDNLENTSKKPIIRREGNKLFTFVESPEYAEYHAEMAKLTKDKDKSPDEFLVF